VRSLAGAEQQQSTTRADLAVARRAAGQWGVLSRAELHACGLTDEAIRVRVRRGNLHPVYRGVYAVGHRNIAVEGRFLAAVKACGPHAVLSHYAAACLHELLKWDGRWIDVTAPTKRSHPGIRAHRAKTIERTLVKGIPVTPKPRTVIDLAKREDERSVTRALRQARFSEAELAQLPRSGLLARIVALPTRSPLEDEVLELVLKGGLEAPLVNAPYQLVGRTVYPDLYWPEQRLIVEVDSAEWHSDPLSQRADLERQAQLEAAGERVLRVTKAQARRRPADTLARLRAAGAPVAISTSGRKQMPTVGPRGVDKPPHAR
jgi:hypothetical protein